ncbi:MAG: hypothetical protein ABEJ85_03200, partial [Haloarculaceae archaeon]
PLPTPASLSVKQFPRHYQGGDSLDDVEVGGYFQGQDARGSEAIGSTNNDDPTDDLHVGGVFTTLDRREN